jgi:hypothetical protein
VDTIKSEPEIKKPYTPPQMVVYGDVGQLTSNNAKSSNSDSGNNGMSPH